MHDRLDEDDLEVGAIYHSHTRTEPVPSQTDINLAVLSRGAVHHRRAWPAGEPDVRAFRIVDGEVSAGRARGGVSSALVCTSCGDAARADERFCPACGLPLVLAGGRRRAARRPAQERARKVRARVRRGAARARSPAARHQAEAELLQGLLLEEGIPSMLRRSGGFDVPDFLAAGPRDVLVPQSGEPPPATRSASRRPDRARCRGAPTRGPWVRALAAALAGS